MSIPRSASRHSTIERGEIRKLTRVFAREATQLYTSRNCTDGFSPVKQHSAFKLAKCLTRTAALDEGNGAIDSIERNTVISDAEP